MNKEKFIEQVYLYLLNELQDSESTELENAMLEDDEFRKEFDSIKTTFSLIEKSKPAEADEPLLISSRQTLMRRIRQSSEEKSFAPDLIEKVKFFFYRNHSLALGGALTLVVSIGIAYMMFLKTAQNNPTFVNPSSGNVPSQNRIVEQTTDSGVTDNSASPFIGKKNAVVPGMYESLINALLGGSNDGIRIKSISAISNKVAETSFKPDPKIKEALITAIYKDKNPAVRMEALIVLKNFPFDDQIRDVMLTVLSKDKNSGIRVAAINALADWNHRQNIIDEILKQELTKQSQAQNNSFVKIRAASILKEIE